MSKIEHSTTGDTMTSAEDMQSHYNPSFETVLREVGDGNVDIDDDDDSHSTLPTPPPPTTTIESILKDLRNTVLFSPRRTKKTVSIDVLDRPADLIAVHDDGGDDESTIEVEAGVPSPRYKKKTSSTLPRDRKRRRGLVCGSCFMFLLVAILGLAVGLSRDKNPRRTAGSSDMLVGGEGETPEPSMMTATSIPTELITTVPPTMVANSTDPPTELLTEPPTDPATPECVTDVEATETCYAPFSGISIYFRNCEPEIGDWIGIWSVSSMEDETGLPEPIQWLFQCGSQDCEQVFLEEDILFFGAGLPEGIFVAVFVRFVELSAPYTSIFAMSNAFQVASRCDV